MTRIRYALALLLIAPIARADDPLPPGAIYRIGPYRMCHGHLCEAMVLSADGNTLAAAGSGVIRVWDAGSLKLIHTFSDSKSPYYGFGNCLALSADGKEVAFGASDGTIHRWDLVTGKKLKSVELPLVSWPCVCISYSPDSKRLMAGYKPVDRSGPYVIEWDLVDRKRNLDRLSPGGPWCQYGGDGRIWMLGKPNSKRVRPVVCVDDLTTGKNRRELLPEEDNERPALSADGQTLALDGKICLRVFNVGRNARSFHEIRRLEGKKASDIQGMCLSAKGDRLAAWDSTVHLCVWDLKNGREIWDARSGADMLNLTFSPNGESLYYNEDFGLVRCWNAVTGEERIPPHTPASVNLAVRSADGGHVVTADDGGEIQLWEAKTGKRLAAWKAHESSIDQLTIAGKQLISVAGEYKDSRWQYKVGCWDISSGRPAQAARKNQLMPTVISTNGSTWVVRDRATYHFHDAAGKERGCATLNVRDHSEYAGKSFEAAISADGRRFAAYDHEGHLTLWDVESTPRFLHSVEIVKDDGGFHEEVHFVELAFSPDGRLLAGVRERGQIELIHTGSGNKKLRVEGSAIAFSPDGLWLATGGSSGEIGICPVDSGGFVMKRSGHQDAITQLHFARSIRTLLSVSGDRTALMWSLRPDLPNPLPKLDALWADLASPDAAKAYRAFWGFIEQPESASFLAERLRTAQKEFDPAKVRKWLAELDDRSFPVRDAASAALARLGPAIEPALRHELELATTAEKRQRLNKLLDAFGRDRPPDQLRLLRAVSALAEIGTPQAKKALQELAKADDLAPLTADARAALQRLE